MVDHFQPVEQFIHRIIDQGRTPAAGIAIAVDGQPVFTRIAGEATPGTPATEQTLWPLSSISKVYTAAAVMSLVEEGRLALSTNVSAVLPEFRGGGREEITLRHLVTHTSGLPPPSDDEVELLRAHAPMEQLVAHGYAVPLLFPPGTGQAYTATGYGVAGLMAAEVAGIPFHDLMRTRVFEPAGLTQSYVRLPAELHPKVPLVSGELGEGTDWAIFSSLYGSQIGHPSNGVTASLPDLLRFLLLFDPNGDRTLHSPAGIRSMTTDATKGFRGSAVGYPIATWGAGFMLQAGTGHAGAASPQSYGHLGGTGCVGWIDPSCGISVAFVSNSHADRGLDEFLDRLAGAVNVAIAGATAQG